VFKYEKEILDETAIMPQNPGSPYREADEIVNTFYVYAPV